VRKLLGCWPNVPGRAEDAANADRDNNEKKQNAYDMSLHASGICPGLYTDEASARCANISRLPGCDGAEESY